VRQLETACVAIATRTGWSSDALAAFTLRRLMRCFDDLNRKKQ